MAGVSIGCVVPIWVMMQSRGVAQRGYDRGDQQIEFQITQGTDCPGPSSNDQITIVFSDQTTDASLPSLALGNDILEEFSFSARDLSTAAARGQVAGSRQIQFKRRVRDRGFLEARFIRVINAGGDGWCGGTLSLRLVDGATLIPTTPLVPRRGNPGNGIQDWNRENWNNRTYWEGDLRRLTAAAARK